MSSPRLTARQLNRATLDRQLLLQLAHAFRGGGRRAPRRCTPGPGAGVPIYRALEPDRRVSTPRIWISRSPSTAVVKATLMRVTLHAVDAADYPRIPRRHAGRHYGRARLNDRRFARVGDDEGRGTTRSCPRSSTTRPHRSRTPRPRHGWTSNSAHCPSRASGGHCARQRRAGPCADRADLGRSARGRRTSPRASRARGRTIRLRRCRCSSGAISKAFGPASVQDIGTFGLVNRALDPCGHRGARRRARPGRRTRQGRGAVGCRRVRRFQTRTCPAPPRLLPMWESTLRRVRGDRARVIPEAYRKVVIRSNGDVLPTLRSGKRRGRLAAA